MCKCVCMRVCVHVQVRMCVHAYESACAMLCVCCVYMTVTSNLSN